MFRIALCLAAENSWINAENLDVENLDVENLDVKNLDVESLNVESLFVTLTWAKCQESSGIWKGLWTKFPLLLPVNSEMAFLFTAFIFLMTVGSLVSMTAHHSWEADQIGLYMLMTDYLFSRLTLQTLGRSNSWQKRPFLELHLHVFVWYLLSACLVNM